MKLGLMQPYFLPYLGYYSLIKQVDCYIFFDTAQYIYHGWVNRNRILKPGGHDWQYINVPVKRHTRDTNIRDIQIDNQQKWREKILGQISHYKKSAPYYHHVKSWLEETLMLHEYVTIGELNMTLDKAVCAYLNIKTHMACLSEMALDIAPVKEPDEWGLHISQAIGNVDEYWNAIGGTTFFDHTKYEQAGIKLRFLQVKLQTYRQMGVPFKPGLSILDVMMFNSPDCVNAMLDEYDLVEG